MLLAKWTRTRRVAPRGLAFVLLATLAGSPGCAYWNPYYKNPQKIVTRPTSLQQIDHRLILIGDAGDARKEGEPVLQMLARHVRLIPERTTVAFLGDNVYERGMPGDEAGIADEAAQAANFLFIQIFDSRDEAERVLDAQMSVVRGTPARAIFIPGNHDWDPLDIGGWERVLSQEAYLDARALDNMDVEMLPGGGCPGPTSVRLGKTGMFVILDTQWWLELSEAHKPQPKNNPTNCEHLTEEAVTTALIAHLEQAAREGRWAIIGAHHPLNSAGPHGGFVDPYTHLFPMRFVRHYVPFYMEWIPMPVLGTMAVLARQNFSPSSQDSSNSRNEHLRTSLRKAMVEAEKRGAPALAYAAGHDHSLQVFKTPKGPRYTLVSGLGSASKASEVGATHNTLFAHAHPNHPGFIQIDFLRNGLVKLTVIEVDGTPAAGALEMFSMYLVDEKTTRVRPPNRPGRWTRMRNRAIDAWRWWRGKPPIEGDAPAAPPAAITPPPAAAPAPAEPAPVDIPGIDEPD